jgi:hypothetical protein
LFDEMFAGTAAQLLKRQMVAETQAPGASVSIVARLGHRRDDKSKMPAQC